MRRCLYAAICVATLAAATRPVAAESLESGLILGPPRAYSIDSVTARYTHFDQSGHGYQSQAGETTFPRVAPGLPGSEFVTVDQPQVEIVAHQGERLTHTLWLPVDVVTAASPDALDAISTASRNTYSTAVQLASSYQASATTNVGVLGGFHLEPNFRSWNVGASYARSLAEDNAVLAASLHQVYDWFDRFNTDGVRNGRVGRSSTNGNLGLTQLLTPTTIAHVDYGVTVQSGVLGNTWNAVPVRSANMRANYVDVELLPGFRQRHAFLGRLVQWLPWNGALRASYRFYVDDWGLVAHSAEAQLFQRLAPWMYLRFTYRVHQQSGVSFYTQLAAPQATLRSADSDLAPFVAQTVGALIAFDLGMIPKLRMLHLEVGYERYQRSNDLAMNIYTGAVGLRF
jgi:hypothetical protein